MEAWRGAPSLAHSLAERRLSCLALFPLELGPRSGANGVTTTHRLSSSGDVGRRDINLISEVQPLFNMRRVRPTPKSGISCLKPRANPLLKHWEGLPKISSPPFSWSCVARAVFPQ